jgi:hypothetical protein
MIEVQGARQRLCNETQPHATNPVCKLCNESKNLKSYPTANLKHMPGRRREVAGDLRMENSPAHKARSCRRVTGGSQLAFATGYMWHGDRRGSWCSLR